MEGFNPDGAGTQFSIALIVAIAGAFVGFIVKSIHNLTNSINNFLSTQNVQAEAVRNILKVLIVLIHDDACDKGYIGKYKLDACERLYTSYAKLKGNSYVEDLMKEMRNLGTRKKS